MLEALLHGLAPADEIETQWGELRLRRRLYLTDRRGPGDLVTSVRAVVFRGRDVMVVRDRTGESHVMPGGRCEAGETLEQTLRRELAEECGWTCGAIRPLGLYHFRHLNPRPDGYAYPYPDFLQAMFVAEAQAYDRKALVRGDWETGSKMVPLTRAAGLLQADQRALLEAALAVR